MASINPVNVLLLLLDYYKPKYPEDSTVNEEELCLKQSLQDTIDTFVVSEASIRSGLPYYANSASDDTIILKLQPVSISNLEADEINAEDDFKTFDEESEEEHQGSLDDADDSTDERSGDDPTYSEPDCQPAKACHSDNVSLDYKKRAVEYWCSAKGGKKRKASCVKSHFSKARDGRVLSEWKKQVDEGGSRSDKLAQIFDKTLALVRAAKERGESMPDSAIQKYAREANAEIKLKGFTASHHWVVEFRKNCPDGFGTRMTRLKEVEQRLKIKCRDEMKEGRILSDKEIKTYAQEINAVVKESTFKGSHTWIMWFRQRHGIKSRIKFRKPNSTKKGVPIDTSKNQDNPE